MSHHSPDEDKSLLAGGVPDPVPYVEWEKHMWPIWIMTLLLLAIEYLYISIFVVSLNLWWVGVGVGIAFFGFVVCICMCCIVPRQPAQHKWLVRVLLLVVLGILGLGFVGGIIGAHYLLQYRMVSTGTTYTDVLPTITGSSLTAAGSLYFDSSAFVNKVGAASNGGSSRPSCVAPIVSSMTQSAISFWAAIESSACCGTTGDAASYTCPGWGITSWDEGIIYQEPTDALYAAAAASITANSYTQLGSAVFVNWVASIDALQQRRLVWTLVAYAVPALVALLWLPSFLVIHHLGGCKWCGNAPRPGAIPV